VGLAGNLASYEFEAADGTVKRGDEIDYNGSPAGYTEDPQENIVYVSAHDNETLFDISQYKHPQDTSTADRARAQNLGIDLTVLAQGVAFLHAGVDLLRSKSLDRDSFNSGDWFNRLDFTYQENNWGVGLPVASKNESEWSIMAPLLADPALEPGPDDIAAVAAHARELLAIRSSSPLFRLPTASDVQDRVAFHNTGSGQTQGLIVMSVSDLVGDDLDSDVKELVVLFNATDEPQSFTMAAATGAGFRLHPVQAASADGVVRQSSFDASSGTFSVPARTTAVFEHQSSRGAISDVLAALEAAGLQGNPARKAIEALERALDPALWSADGDSPADAKAERTIYRELKKAVLELGKIRGLDAADRQLVDDAIDVLVTEARLMAERALATATAAGGDPKDLAQAEKALSLAEAQLAKGKPDVAIAHYGDAAAHARRAME
jgi:hypothetical protein